MGIALTAVLSVLYAGYGLMVVDNPGCNCVREPCPCRSTGADMPEVILGGCCFATLLIPWVYWRWGRRTETRGQAVGRLLICLAGYLVPLLALAVLSIYAELHG